MYFYPPVTFSKPVVLDPSCMLDSPWSFLKIPRSGPTSFQWNESLVGPGIWGPGNCIMRWGGIEDRGPDSHSLTKQDSVIRCLLFQPRSVRVQPHHHQRGSWGMQLGAKVLLKLEIGFLAASISNPWWLSPGPVLRPGMKSGLSGFLSILHGSSKTNESDSRYRNE